MTQSNAIALLASNIREFATRSESGCQVWNIPDLSKPDILQALTDGFEVIPTWDGEITDVKSGSDESDHGKNSNRFSFHTDGVYYQNTPHFAILYCVQTGGSGGETFFARTKGVIKALREEFGDNLVDSMNVVYMERDGQNYRHPLVEVVSGTEILRWSSALYLEPDVRRLSTSNRKRFTQILPEFIAFIQRAMEEQICYRHTWSKGDVLIFNNRECVHGRTQIIDPAGDRHLLRVLFNNKGRADGRVFAPRAN